ncbi:MAG: GtrA family protein [bacterium]|nr:GtrA family protein [bacterium]
MFTKKDLFSSIFTGFYTGLIVWQIFDFLNVPKLLGQNIVCITTPCQSFEGISWAWFIVLVPIFWILGVNLGYFLGRWIPFFNQFGRFSAIGFTNAAVDFGVLNLLIAWSGIAAGILYTLFKTISFIISVSHSYYWNRHWVFESQNQEKGKEFFEFISVYIIAAMINIGAASAVVNFVDPMFGMNEKVWANIGAVTGSAVALVFSFAGVKTLVFKKKEDALP